MAFMIECWILITIHPDMAMKHAEDRFTPKASVRGGGGGSCPKFCEMDCEHGGGDKQR